MNPNGREPYLSGGVCRMTKHQVADELMALSHNLEIAKHHQVAPLCPYAPLCTVHCAKHPDRRTSPNAPKVLCTMHYTLCTIHYALYTMHYTLCTMHYTQSPDRQTSPPCSVLGTFLKQAFKHQRPAFS